MQAVVLAAGKGTRLRPLTDEKPKVLVEVNGTPLIQDVFDNLIDAGATELVVVVGYKAEQIIDRFGDEYAGVPITYTHQREQLGLAHAILQAEPHVDGDFMLMLGDNVFRGNLGDVTRRQREDRADAAFLVEEVPYEEASRYGVLDTNEYGEITEVVEKPDDPPSNLALIGIYVFSPAIFDAIADLEPSWRGELEITDAIQSLLDDGHSIDSAVVEGWWKDTGKPKDVLEANRLVLEDAIGIVDGTIEDGADVSGQVDVADGAIIEDGAVVRGPVSIGEDVRITSDTYLGPYTSIGAGSTIEDAHVENTVVAGEGTIRTSVKIVDSLIGEGATIDTADDLLPEGKRLVVGENSQLKL